jgi:hypothetical protein
MPESNRGSRWTTIRELSERISTEQVSWNQLSDVLQGLEGLFRSMSVHFQLGRVKDGWDLDSRKVDLDLQRYMCAALLPEVVRHFDKLHEQTAKKKTKKP